MTTPWSDRTDDELARGADNGLRGQGEAVESQRRLRVAIENLIALSEDAGKQNQTMIRLTRWVIALTFALMFLTIALGWIAVLQLMATK